MNLAGHDFKMYLKVFDVSDFTRFSFNGFTSHFNPKLWNYPLWGSSSMPRNLSCDKDIIGNRALHLGVWYGHSKSWIVEMFF